MLIVRSPRPGISPDPGSRGAGEKGRRRARTDAKSPSTIMRCVMQNCLRIGIDEVKGDAVHGERHSKWIDGMSTDLRVLVKKAKIVKIVVRKNGTDYLVVFGHHLLKAAEESGLHEVYAYVMEPETKTGQKGDEEAFMAFRKGVEEIVSHASHAASTR